jgi:hypothetical protein
VASLLPSIPVEFLNPRQKYALMNYLVNLGLPARIMKQALKDWGESLGVEISAGDYQLLDNHLRTEVAIPPA